MAFTDYYGQMIREQQYEYQRAMARLREEQYRPSPMVRTPEEYYSFIHSQPYFSASSSTISTSSTSPGTTQKPPDAQFEQLKKSVKEYKVLVILEKIKVDYQ